MSELLDEVYLTWLYSQVADVGLKNPSRTYWSLFRQLYRKEFIWLIPNDDNRAEDGRLLRVEFLDNERIAGVDSSWMELGCSMLEMLIALARRLSFEDDATPSAWFWRLLENLGLEVYNDRQSRFTNEINEVLDRVILRTYEPDGSGGLFPLKNPSQDQRDVEIWYQLSAYLLE